MVSRHEVSPRRPALKPYADVRETGGIRRGKNRAMAPYPVRYFLPRGDGERIADLEDLHATG
jgi:hypothetical protein